MRNHRSTDQAYTVDQARRTQVVVDQVLVQLDDLDPDISLAEQMLRRAIAVEGLPERPTRWVRATAVELAAGRRVVIDLRDLS